MWTFLICSENLIDWLVHVFHPDALISDKFSFLLQSFPMYKLKNHYKYKENNVGYKWYINKTHQNENVSGDLKKKSKGIDWYSGKVTFNTGLNSGS